MASPMRPIYGLRVGAENRMTMMLSRLPQGPVIIGAVTAMMGLCFIPVYLLKVPLPHTMTPEYMAATRAYMRYHNMNPIFGISSKKQREEDRFN